MKLTLADGLSLPLDAVTQKLAWLGVTGSGKTYGASKLAELFWHAGAQVIVLDPVGVWYGLRLAKNGKTPSDLTVPIFGGLHGDIPLEPTAGALIANLVVDKTLSAVVDVSQFESDADKARFARDFADRFFFRKKAAPSAVHVILEECQEFVPQNPQKGEERMLHAFVRLQKLGRNFGIGSSYVSQRPQEVNKKALNMAQTLFVFRTTGSHERAAIEKWIEDKALDEDIAGDLPKIVTGHCHVWSPEFLKISETVHILGKETFNASATPEVGVKATTRELAPIDLERVRSDMAATIEKAKADDPRELRKTIAELKKQQSLPDIVRCPACGTPPPKDKFILPYSCPTCHAGVLRWERVGEKKAVEQAALTDADRALLEKLRTRVDDIGHVLLEGTTVIADRLAGFMRDEAQTAISAIGEKHEKARAQYVALLDSKGFQKILSKLAAIPPLASGPIAQTVEPLSRKQVVVGSIPVRSSPSRPVVPSTNGHSPAQQRILNGLAFLSGIGASPADKTQLALIVGVSPTSGGYFNNLGALRSMGFIDYPSGGTVALTEAGAALASTDGIPTTTDELHDAIRAKLPAAKWKILEVLIRHYPRALTKDDLAQSIEVSPTSGGYFNNLGSLRSLGLVDYPQPGTVAAQPILFLEDR